MAKELPGNCFRNYIRGRIPDTLFKTDEELQAKAKHISDILCEKGGIKHLTPKQRVEKGHFKFDYHEEALSCDFEHTHPQTIPVQINGKWQEKNIILSTPIYNEFAPRDAAFIDWLTFSFQKCHYDGVEDDEDIIACLSQDLTAILGFGVTQKRDVGINGYTHSYILGKDFGLIGIGGNSQKNTVSVAIKGKGCEAATRKGRDWELNMKLWAENVYGFRITRVDVTHDCIDGEYTVDDAIKDYDDGLFNSGGRKPSIEQRGDWRTHYNEKGRTVNVGRRESGKVCRIYEKGKQLGQTNSEWVRVECELHNTNRCIPLDILTEPGCYIAGAYPALMKLIKYAIPQRIKTLSKKAKIVYDKAVEIAKRQIGAIIWLMGKVEKNPEDIFKKLEKTPQNPCNRYLLLFEELTELGNIPTG